MQIKKAIVTILDSKLSFLAAVFIGLAIGLYLPNLSTSLGYISELFIDMMKMCVLPIVITSVTLSIAHFTSTFGNQKPLRITFVSLLTLMLCAAIGMLIAWIFEPGAHLDTTNSADLKAAVDKSALTIRGLYEPFESKVGTGALELILNLIPNNIFGALAKNSVLQIIVFAVIFGIALGKYSEVDAHIKLVIQQTLDVFTRIFNAISFIFPIILAFIVAHDVSKLGPETFVGMGPFITQYYIAVIVLFCITSIVMILHMRIGLRDWISIIREPVIIALATQSSTASIPPSIVAMKRFNYNPNLVQLLIPLGSIIGRYGNILYFGFCTMFAVQLYHVDLLLPDYILLLFLTILAGISTSGQSGILSLSALALVLTPVGIPYAGFSALLIAIDTVIDPARTLAIVHTNCAAVSLMSEPLGKPLSFEEIEDQLIEEEITVEKNSKI